MRSARAQSYSVETDGSICSRSGTAIRKCSEGAPARATARAPRPLGGGAQLGRVGAEQLAYVVRALRVEPHQVHACALAAATLQRRAVQVPVGVHAQ